MENMGLAELQFIIPEELFFFKEAIHSNGTTANKTSVELHSVVGKAAPKTVEMEQEATKDPIQIRGNFANGVLVLHEEEALDAEVMDMLVKMINAVGHSMNEIGMLSSKELEGRSLEEFYELNAHKVLKFGRIKHAINAMPASDYQIHTEKETEYLFADSLSDITGSKDLKAKLWNTLKVLFNISKK